jgi:dephospho-CoA kinase
MVVIGLCGLNGGGKGVVAAMLKNRGFIAYSTSDILREECFKKGLDAITRDKLAEEGTRMRKLFGPDVLAHKVVERIYTEEGASLPKRDVLRGNYVLESIRNTGEVKFLRTIPGFVLWSIDADTMTRFERLKARKREADSQTFEDFLRVETGENSKEESGQQLVTTSALADDHIVNQGTQDDLQVALDAKLRTTLARAAAPTTPIRR